VYRAWDADLRREVAVKLPRDEFRGQTELMERVLREARSAAQLRHPAIVPIYEVGQHGNTTYIVYQFIPGPTLAKLLSDTHPSAKQAAEWVARIAEALHYAHECGVVHRDVKPSNIMMQKVEGRGSRVEEQKGKCDDRDTPPSTPSPQPLTLNSPHSSR
jgi:serine/threonine-protein kinase